MRVNIIEKIAGTTIKVTWVNSGVTVSPLSSALLDRNEALVHSIAASSSGDGFYYALHPLPTSPGQWYVNQWIGVINANTFKERQLVKAIFPEVD